MLSPSSPTTNFHRTTPAAPIASDKVVSHRGARQPRPSALLGGHQQDRVACSSFVQHRTWRNTCGRCGLDSEYHDGTSSPCGTIDHNSTTPLIVPYYSTSGGGLDESSEHIYENPSSIQGDEDELDNIVDEDEEEIYASVGDQSSSSPSVPSNIVMSSTIGGTTVSSTAMNGGDRSGGLLLMAENRTLSSLDGGDSMISIGSNTTRSVTSGIGSGGGTVGTLNDRRRHCLSPSIRLRLAADSHRQSTSDDDSGCALEEYSWVPSALRPNLVHQYFSCIPEDKVPYTNSVGEKWRVRQLLLQLPPHDTEARYCRHLNGREQKELRAFAQQRKRDSLGRGSVRLVPYNLEASPCADCSQSVYAGDLGVFASRCSEQTCWHPSCFACYTCRELLIDLIYFHKDGRLYCGRHHAEQLKPRCAACDEIIFSEECTEAEGRSWHLHHFACFQCDQSLGGLRYVMRDDRPYCLQCFETRFADPCTACRRPIAVDQARMSHGRQQWHADNACFACTTCRKALLGKPFLPKEDEGLFCGPECLRRGAGGGAPSASKPGPRSMINEGVTKSIVSNHRPIDRVKLEQLWTEVDEEEEDSEEDDVEVPDGQSDYETISPKLYRSRKTADRIDRSPGDRRTSGAMAASDRSSRMDRSGMTMVLMQMDRSQTDRALVDRSDHPMARSVIDSPRKSNGGGGASSSSDHRRASFRRSSLPDLSLDEILVDTIDADRPYRCGYPPVVPPPPRTHRGDRRDRCPPQPTAVRTGGSESSYKKACSNSVITTLIVSKKETTFGVESMDDPNTPDSPSSTSATASASPDSPSPRRTVRFDDQQCADTDRHHHHHHRRHPNPHNPRRSWRMATATGGGGGGGGGSGAQSDTEHGSFHRRRAPHRRSASSRHQHDPIISADDQLAAATCTTCSSACSSSISSNSNSDTDSSDDDDSDEEDEDPTLAYFTTLPHAHRQNSRSIGAPSRFVLPGGSIGQKNVDELSKRSKKQSQKMSKARASNCIVS